MNLRTFSSWRMLMLVVAVLAAASLACASPGGASSTSVPAAATNTTAPTDAPEAATDVPAPTQAPTDAPEPTEEGGTTGSKNDGGTTGGGGTTTGGTTGGSSGSANLINAGNAGDVEQLCGVDVSDTQLRAVAAHPINHEVATFGFDKVPRIFDGDSCTLLGGLEPLADSGWGLSYSPDGTALAVGGGYQVRLYDAGNGNLLTANTVNAFVFKTVWYGNTDLAVVGQNSSRIDVLNLESGSTDQITTPENVILWSVAFSPDQTLLVTGNANGGVRVIDIGTADVIFSTQTKGAVLDLEFSPDGSRMAACNGSGHVYVWDTSSWDITLSSEIGGDPVHPGGCQDGAFGADGSIYITGGADGYVNFYDANEGDLLNYFWWDGLPQIESVSVTGDGELVAVVHSLGGLGIFSLP